MSGTIASFGTLTAAGTPLALTVATPFVNANSWVVVEAGGTVATSVGLDAVITCHYVMGY